MAPVATAGSPVVGVKVAPDNGGGQQGDPYYLWANVTSPEAPRAPKPQDDCWQPRDGEPRPPPSPDAALLALLFPILNWDPLAEPRLSGWFPRCIATEVHLDALTGGSARLSYDVTTGRYVLVVDNIEPPATPAIPVGPIGLPLPRFMFSFATVETTGTTGVSMVTDCEQCPPPV